VVATITVGLLPVAVAITPDGTLACVTNDSSRKLGNRLAISAGLYPGISCLNALDLPCRPASVPVVPYNYSVTSLDLQRTAFVDAEGTEAERP
jgi:DNA-binding beta-propeller fold protein YncE